LINLGFTNIAMKILGLCSYPVESAATRYRLAQFVEPLAKKGITLKISPFLDSEQYKILYRDKSVLQKISGLPKSLLKRLSGIFRLREYDLILVQREAMFFGPAFFEWIVYQQSQRWIRADVFEAIVADLREVLRITAGKKAKPTAVIFDSRTWQSSPESGARAEYDGAKRRTGSKTHIAVDTLGNLLALLVTAADKQDRAPVGELAQLAQAATGETVEIAFVDQGYTGENVAEQAQAQGIRLEVVKLAEAKKGFVLLPRRWVVKRSFGWAARFRKLWRDCIFWHLPS